MFYVFIFIFLIFHLFFQTAYEPGHAETVINIIEKLHYDVNSVIPSNGLTLFLVCKFASISHM